MILSPLYQRYRVITILFCTYRFHRNISSTKKTNLTLIPLLQILVLAVVLQTLFVLQTKILSLGNYHTLIMYCKTIFLPPQNVQGSHTETVLENEFILTTKRFKFSDEYQKRELAEGLQPNSLPTHNLKIFDILKKFSITLSVCNPLNLILKGGRSFCHHRSFYAITADFIQQV